MTDSNISAEALLESEPMTDQDLNRGKGQSDPLQAPDGPPEAEQVDEQGPAPTGDLPDSSDLADSSLAEPVQAKTGPGEELSDDELVEAVSALIFASPDPLGQGRLVKLLEDPRPGRVVDALKDIQSRLENSGLPFELREIAGGWRLMTAPSASETVARLVKARKNDKLSPAGLETLAVIAYRQPVTKAEIEAIRGVQCGPMLRGLVDRGLAKVVGRADVPGGPLQYGTTKQFLDRFGMASLKDLPRDSELLKE